MRFVNSNIPHKKVYFRKDLAYHGREKLFPKSHPLRTLRPDGLMISLKKVNLNSGQLRISPVRLKELLFVLLHINPSRIVHF